jgi:Nuclease-related domain
MHAYQKAGAPIRKLSWKRKFSAAGHWFKAGLVAMVVLCFPWAFPSVIFPSLWYGGLLLSLYYVWQAKQLAKKSKWAHKGAEAEEKFAKMLRFLPPGWTKEFNRNVYPIGDVDVILTASDGLCWVIDVKSHHGKIVAKGKKIERAGQYPLKGDFVSASRRQAQLVGQMHGVKATPVIFFVNAHSVPNAEVDGVLVTNRKFW